MRRRNRAPAGTVALGTSTTHSLNTGVGAASPASTTVPPAIADSTSPASSIASIW